MFVNLIEIVALCCIGTSILIAVNTGIIDALISYFFSSCFPIKLSCLALLYSDLICHSDISSALHIPY